MIQEYRCQISFKKFRQEIKFISTVKYNISQFVNSSPVPHSAKQGLNLILNLELSYTPLQDLLVVDRCIYSCITIEVRHTRSAIHIEYIELYLSKNHYCKKTTEIVLSAL